MTASRFGYLFSEWFMWHNPGLLQNVSRCSMQDVDQCAHAQLLRPSGCLLSHSATLLRLRFMEPTRHWESVETKRRVHSLLDVSGLLDHAHLLKARPATLQELTR